MHKILLISTLLAIPLISCIFVLISPKNELQNAKLTALCGSFIVLAVAIMALITFDFGKDSIQFLEEYSWIPEYNIKYKVGLDRYSIFFILMIASISFLSMLWILKKNIHKTKHFFIAILLFESCSIGAFVSYDMFLLLFFMEATIAPLFIMMHTSPKHHNKEAITQFLVYETISAMFIMASIIMIYKITGTSDIVAIHAKGSLKSSLPFWTMFVGFAIKLPIIPFHNWLPKVHVESPTVCSVLLASIVLKFSALLSIKLLYPLFSNEIILHKDLINIWCLIGAFVACINLFFQNDMKKFFAYFSMLHMNAYAIILFSGTAIQNFVFSVLYHSFLIAILFFVTDVIKTVFKTRDFIELKSVKFHFIKIKHLMFINTLFIIGVPLSWGFITEIICIYSISNVSTWAALGMAAVILVSSARAFFIYHNLFGNWKVNTVPSIDMFHISNISKNIVIYVIIGVILFIGITPGMFL